VHTTVCPSDSIAPGPIVLLIDRPSAATSQIIGTLERLGYAVWHAESGATAKQLLVHGRRAEIEASVIIVADHLPDVHPLVLCAALRKISDAAIVAQAESDNTVERTIGYRVGVDAFISRPANHDELPAAIEAVLRRGPTQDRRPLAPSEQVVVGDLLIDEDRRSVTTGPRSVDLTPTQFRLLVTLARRPDQIVTLERLMDHIWKVPNDPDGTLIANQIGRLRSKLREAGVSSPSIVNILGIGYRLSVQS
jgi:DNA-binding response OmpR family regulator